MRVSPMGTSKRRFWPLIGALGGVPVFVFSTAMLAFCVTRNIADSFVYALVIIGILIGMGLLWLQRA
jgi:hypothetical protein